VTVLQVKPYCIPAALRATPRWAVWHHQVDDRGHLSKPPFQANGSGERAYATEPDTWSSFDEAFACYCAHLDTYEGISFAIVDHDDIVGIDLDHVEEHLSEALEIVRTVASYTEVSPSAEGLRIFCRGYLPHGRRIREWVEMYSGKRFLTVTGAHVLGTPLDLTANVAQLEAVWDLYVQQAWRPLIGTGRGR
jgi:primase-polymerase (primpol)-like protein